MFGVTITYVIEHGGNIIIYPEGYWNFADDGQADERHLADGHNSESWLMQDINIGILRLAKETGCEIVPTILHYDEVGKKRCYAHRGKASALKNVMIFLLRRMNLCIL